MLHLLSPLPRGRVVLLSELSAEKRSFRRSFDGFPGIVTRRSTGVLSQRVVTTAGVNFLATAFINTVEPEVINYHATGTGSTAEAIGDTALVTEVESTRATGTQSNPSGNVYKSAGTITYTATRGLWEHGIFSALTTGTLWDRSVFAAVLNVINGDIFTWNYSLTLSAGG